MSRTITGPLWYYLCKLAVIVLETLTKGRTYGGGRSRFFLSSFSKGGLFFADYIVGKTEGDVVKAPG